MEGMHVRFGETELSAHTDPSDLWEYASDPWATSNPNEHYGLVYFYPENRPGQGVKFHQCERVAGIYTDLWN
jgi:hypothetical protein